jgi:transposase
MANLVASLAARGWSQRRIARELDVSRNTVRAVLERHHGARQQGHSALPALPRRRASRLDEHDDFLRKLLTDFPDLSAVRVHQELLRQGFQGGYTIVKERLRRLRPTPKAEPAHRIDTAEGEQGQQDWSPYAIEFTGSGTTEVHCFSLVLAYSRRQYVDFCEREDFYTLIRQHQAAFEYWQGAPREILYDNQKAVVLGWECGRPLYNPKFLSFATHYGFRPRALRPRKPEWKGKVERPFQYVEGNCLAGRKFRDPLELRTHARWWMENVVDTHVHDTTRERPLDRFAREKSSLLSLPAHPYDTAEVG